VATPYSGLSRARSIASQTKEIAVPGLACLIFMAASLAPDEPAPADPIVSPADFQEWFEKAREGRLTIPLEVSRNARCYRFVFVGGFQNERMPGYFAQNAQELRAHGVPRKSIHFIYPSSRETVEDNAHQVCSEFREIASKGPEPLVVIAHSRGACDALAFALGHSHFIAERVPALFLVQGPFGGSGVADYVLGEGPTQDRRIPAGHRLIGYLLAGAEAYLVKRGNHGGLHALTTRASQEFWEQIKKDNEAAISIVGPRTFFVTSQTTPGRLRLLQRAAAWYVETGFGPNDGLVALEDQSVPGVGTVLAVLDAGHTDLTNRFPSASRKRRFRKALVDAIVMAVGSGADVSTGRR
jgi:hypothetical protein